MQMTALHLYRQHPVGSLQRKILCKIVTNGYILEVTMIKLIMPILKIPQPLQSYTGGESQLKLSGGTVREMIDDLTLKYPTLKPHLINKKGNLNVFVHLFLHGEEIPQNGALDMKLKTEDVVTLVPSIAGG
jgi:sulfur-carrier protein